MELVIEGFQKLLVKTFAGRKITDIQIESRDRGFGKDNSYVFTFGKMPLTSQSNANAMGKGWEDTQEVWLSKLPNSDGRYEMFVMGIHGKTCFYLTLEHVRSFDEFCAAMRIVMERCKEYWDNL